MKTGFLIVATDKPSESVYDDCAKALSYSIRKVMPNANITLLTNNDSNNTYVNNIVKLPYGDLTGFYNDWQVYDASPYQQTIKLEADMIIPKDILYWFDVLDQRDLAICSTIRNYKNEISNIRTYRKFIDDNKLPDTYNAITYFKKSKLAENFYFIVKNIFENWQEYKTILQCKVDEEPTTDFVYALAANIVGVEECLFPKFDDFSMVHMKQLIAGTHTEDWTNTLVYEILPDVLRVQTYSQCYPFHYHKKSFAKHYLEV
jgi:hypothetical protein